MIKRRRGVVLKLLGLLLAAWLLGIIYFGADFFTRSSLDNSDQSQFSTRENRGAEGVHNTIFGAGSERLDGQLGRHASDSAMDKQLLQQFQIEQKRLSELLSGKNPAWFQSSTVYVDEELQQFDPQTRNLVQLGLIVPKWNKNVEKPQHAGAPGELGAAIEMKRDDLSESEKTLYDVGWQANAFNNYANERMSLHRSLPDVRDEACRSMKYQDDLPDTSVIIIFHNEAWMALLRTVHSVLDRSPPHLIREIILVDDFSTHDFLKSKLDEYMAKLGKVRILRSPKREGLIRARLLGSSAAVGKVLTFLDSHCECALGWLEPLLDRIAANKSNVVTPVIDVINDHSMLYMYGNARSTNVGGFDWNLQFNWHAIPVKELEQRKSDIDPLRSPTMAGGLFAISREYFEYIGSYDAGMDVWGGENLELSFRVWMCGGTLEIIPCSHVGHIFRSRSPYSWDTPNALRKNSIRLAVVWMDNFSKYYYDKTGHVLGDYGDVSQRRKLREKLKCKSFDWYLKNVYPELFIPGEALASGPIRSKLKNSAQENVCLDAPLDRNSLNNNPPVNLHTCYASMASQDWMLSKTGEIRREDSCIDYAGQSVMVYGCHGLLGNQDWVYGLDNTIRQRASNLCLEHVFPESTLKMMPCVGTDSQIWHWERRIPDSHRTPEPPR